MPQTTVKQRFLVISQYNKGKSVNFISKSMKIPRTTTYNIIQRYKKDPTTLENRPKTGRPQILDKFEQKLIIRKCLAQPNLNSTQLLASLELSQKVSKSYVRKLLLRNGLHAKVCTSITDEYVQKLFKSIKNLLILTKITRGGFTRYRKLQYFT